MTPSQAREETLFALALERPAAERAAFLKVVCGADDNLRQRLESLLASHEQSNPSRVSPDAETTADQARPTLKVTPEPMADEAVGQTLGRYKLLERIGEGGCGVVYVAEQTEPVRRRVALKVIKLGMDTKQVVARFEAERQALAMMDHPNIAKVLDAGTTELGRPYFVMELVRGIRITDYCDQGQLSTKDRLDLFIKVCQAIQHAHQKGIIHRDIKPSNILVTLHDGVAVPKVIDFGIAKATEGRLTEHTVYTQLNQFIGTPAYMSPEQAEMSGLDIDTRSDIYSLGVLLYELLAGSPPFDPKDLMASGIDAMRKTIREKDPVRPSTKLATLKGDELTTTAKRRSAPAPKLIQSLQGDLDWIVMKCLEKDRQRRYETANGLAMDIHRHLSGEPVVAAPPSSIYRLKKFVLRNRATATAGAAVALALLLGLIAFAWQAAIARRQRDRAVAAEAETTRRADELAKVARFQSGMLSQIDATEAGVKLMASIREKFVAALTTSGMQETERTNRTEAFARELMRINATDTAAEMIDRIILKPAIKAIDAEFKAQPAVDARLRDTLAELYRALGLYPEALPLAEQALATRRRVLGEDHPDTLLSINNLGVVLEAQGKLPEAEKYYREAYEKRRRVLGEDHPDTLTSMGNEGNFLRVQGKLAEAEPLLRGGVEKSRRVLGEGHRDTLIAINCLGYLFISQGKLAEAEPLWREAYEKGRRAFGEDDPDVLVWMNNLAGLLQAQGKLKEAEPYYRESLEKHRRIRGEDHPATLQAIETMASALARQGRFAESEPLYLEALAKSRRVLGNDHPDTLLCMNNLGDLYNQQGRLTEGEDYMRQVLAARRRLFGEDAPDTIVSMSMLAKLLSNEAKLSEAESLYREALERSERTLGKQHPDTLVMMINLGTLLLQKAQLDEAETYIRAALEGRRRVSGEDHPETLIALSNLGRLVEQQGKLAEAEQIDRDALARFQRTQGKDHPSTLNCLVNLASVLRVSGKPSEAEPLYREAVTGMERKLGKAHARTAGAHLGLGKTLVDLNRFAEAEPELIEAERTLATVQGVPAARRRQGVESLVALYNAWDKAEPGKGYDAKGAVWKQKLEGLTPAATEKQP